MSKIEQLLKIIDKDDFSQFYSTHTQAETVEHYNISQYLFCKIIDAFGFEKHLQAEVIAMGVRKKYGVDNISFLPSTTEKIKATKKAHFGDENYHNIEKAMQTNLEKYGSVSPFGNADVRAKSTQTVRERYGVDNVFQDEAVKEKSRQTKEIVYGDANYNNREKMEQTCLERYGVSNMSKCKESRMRAAEHGRQTNLERYGVPYACMLDRCMSASNGYGGFSKPNIAFGKLLTKKHIEYSTEFVIGRYSYDLR